MLTYPLSRWVNFGKLDSSDPIDFDFEVTEEEHALLQKYDDEGWCLGSVPELETLYERALDESTELSIAELREGLEPDEEDSTDYYEYRVGFRVK